MNKLVDFIGALRVGFSVYSLGSGSSGNSMLISAGHTRILIDVGISVLQLQKRLSKYRVRLDDLDGIFLTHEHGDHARSAYALSKRFGIPIIANPATLTVLSRESAPPNWYVLDTGCCMSLRDIVVESFPVSHDAVDPVGYNVYYGRWKVSFVTDTGVAGDEILRSVEGANLTIIEANHDVDRLLSGPYPPLLKRRILSDRGHLSNEAAADLAVSSLARSSKTSCIWLAHLSKTNNTPRMARRYVQHRLSKAGFQNIVVGVALPNAPNLTWRPTARPCRLHVPESKGLLDLPEDVVQLFDR